MAFQSRNESSSRFTLGSSRRRSSKQDMAGGAVSTFSSVFGRDIIRWKVFTSD